MQVFADMARSTLVTDSGTTLTVADGARFPQATRGAAADSEAVTWFKLVLQRGDLFEICHVRTHTGDGVFSNVLRGQEGTTQRTWEPGDTTATLAVVASDAGQFRDKLSDAPSDGKQYARKDGAWVEGGGSTSIDTLAYDARAGLRTMTPDSGGDLVIVDGLGLFQYVADSDEPDDDESCFATATGRWLLMCPHWDVVNDWQLPDDDERNGRIDDALAATTAYEDRTTTLEGRTTTLEGRMLYGTASCAITSVAAVSSVTFVGTVVGAAVGDCVLVTPPNQLGNNASSTGRLSYHAYVSAADTVTVVLCNASAAAATTNTAVQAAWHITVFKGV